MGTRSPGTGTRSPAMGTRSPAMGTRSPGTGTRSPGMGTRFPAARLALRRWASVFRQQDSLSGDGYPLSGVAQWFRYAISWLLTSRNNHSAVVDLRSTASQVEQRPAIAAYWPAIALFVTLLYIPHLLRGSVPQIPIPSFLPRILLSSSLSYLYSVSSSRRRNGRYRE